MLVVVEIDCVIGIVVSLFILFVAINSVVTRTEDDEGLLTAPLGASTEALIIVVDEVVIFPEDRAAEEFAKFSEDRAANVESPKEVIIFAYSLAVIAADFSVVIGCSDFCTFTEDDMVKSASDEPIASDCVVPFGAEIDPVSSGG
jgi:hypothetical protein